MSERDTDTKNKFQLVLGLEIHLHVKTKTKMFCGCSTDIYNAKPNTHTCPTCLGLPGALPVPNYDAVKRVQQLGLALGCELNKQSNFDRKHYFYPDLPKGYQISQYKRPLCGSGYLTLDSGNKISIERIHLEEDTAKSFHQGLRTHIDFNKSGMPLAEIVTEPVFEKIEDAVEFCKKIQTVVRTLDIGDADMEKGQMRLEANISLRTPEMKKHGKLPSYKVEVKNINSFRFMERAVKDEIVRQAGILSEGGTVLQENRGYDEATGKTVPQRAKEEAHDYRYFPEPDIPPMLFSEEYIKELNAGMLKTPEEMVKTLIDQFNLEKRNADAMIYNFGKGTYDKFIEICREYDDYKKAANYLINKKEFQNLSPEEFLCEIKKEKMISQNVNDITNLAERVIRENEKAVDAYKKGNSASVEYLLGQVMKLSQGKADPGTTRNILQKLLKK